MMISVDLFKTTRALLWSGQVCKSRSIKVCRTWEVDSSSHEDGFWKGKWVKFLSKSKKYKILSLLWYSYRSSLICSLSNVLGVGIKVRPFSNSSRSDGVSLWEEQRTIMLEEYAGEWIESFLFSSSLTDLANVLKFAQLSKWSNESCPFHWQEIKED